MDSPEKLKSRKKFIRTSLLLVLGLFSITTIHFVLGGGVGASYGILFLVILALPHTLFLALFAYGFERGLYFSILLLLWVLFDWVFILFAADPLTVKLLYVALNASYL